MGGIDRVSHIKERVPLEEAVRFYGFEPNRAGYLHCPFHGGDRTPSLKLYPNGWHCFGCGRGGSVIDFVMALYGLDFRQACLRLDRDFGLGLSEQRMTRADYRALQLARQRAEEDKRKRAQEEAEELALLEEHRYWWEVKQAFAPETYGPEHYIHPLYEQAVKELPWLAYLLDCCADRRWSVSKRKRSTATTPPCGRSPERSRTPRKPR